MGERRLDSWKQIGAYLGRSARTVQRWERQEGLPVHRLQHDKLGSVYAFPSELDAWWESRRRQLGGEPAEGDEIQEATPGLAPGPDPIGKTAGVAPEGARSSARLLAVIGLLAVLALVLLAAWAWRSPRPAPPAAARLAVLPLQTLGSAPGDDYLGDGLTEELIATLSQLDPERLRVIARTSVMRFKGTSIPVAAIGRELGVDYVIEGSVRRSEERLRVTAQLIRVADETHLWAESFDAGLGDALALQVEVAEQIARQAHVNLTPEGRARLAPVPIAPEAQDAYLRARHLIARGDPEDLRRAIAYLQEAARAAPRSAPVHAGIAEAYVGLAGFGYGGAPAAEVVEPARAAARRALGLDPDSAHAHVALGSVLFFGDWDWTGALREYDLAVALDPGGAQARRARSLFLMAAGRVDEGLADARRALDLDPLSPASNRNYVTHLYFARRYDEAVAHAKRTLELEPADTGTLDDLAELYWQTGEWESFFGTLQREADLMGLGEWGPALREAHRRGGPSAIGEEFLRLFGRLPEPPSPFLAAEVHARSGNVEPALQWLERALADRAAQMVFVERAPYFEALRGQPRFEAIVRRVRPRP